jgi:hypothetical protein
VESNGAVAMHVQVLLSNANIRVGIVMLEPKTIKVMSPLIFRLPQMLSYCSAT